MSTVCDFFCRLELIQLPISSEIMYAFGTINKVNTVEEVRPPITVMASGLHRLDPSWVLIAMGKSPRSVVAVVINIGLKRSRDARMMAFT